MKLVIIFLLKIIGFCFNSVPASIDRLTLFWTDLSVKVNWNYLSARWPVEGRFFLVSYIDFLLIVRGGFVWNCTLKPSIPLVLIYEIISRYGSLGFVTDRINTLNHDILYALSIFLWNVFTNLFTRLHDLCNDRVVFYRWYIFNNPFGQVYENRYKKGRNNLIIR